SNAKPIFRALYRFRQPLVGQRERAPGRVWRQGWEAYSSRQGQPDADNKSARKVVARVAQGPVMGRRGAAGVAVRRDPEVPLGRAALLLPEESMDRGGLARKKPVAARLPGGDRGQAGGRHPPQSFLHSV